MKFLFDDESFSFETLRTTGFAAYGGGADSFADLIRRVKDYTLDGIAHKIVAPTLIMDPENDQYLKGQPQLVQKALTGASTTLVTLTEHEGAGEHTHAGGLARAHQVMFDWLDATLITSSGRKDAATTARKR